MNVHMDPRGRVVVVDDLGVVVEALSADEAIRLTRKLQEVVAETEKQDARAGYRHWPQARRER